MNEFLKNNPSHGFHEAGVELILSEDVQVEGLDSEKHSRFDHGERLLQPLPTGHHSQVHGRLGSPLNAMTSCLHLTTLTHDVPAGRGQSQSVTATDFRANVNSQAGHIKLFCYWKS